MIIGGQVWFDNVAVAFSVKLYPTYRNMTRIHYTAGNLYGVKIILYQKRFCVNNRFISWYTLKSNGLIIFFLQYCFDKS